MTKVIALLTDFGLDDIYVSVMKAVMLNICPSAQIVDVTHAVQPQNVREAAFALLNSYHYFPTGTTFCVVVDPGVGSDRLAIAVKSKQYHFVAPDNGILSYALAHLGADYQAILLENPSYQAQPLSRTFPWARYFRTGSRPSRTMARGVCFDGWRAGSDCQLPGAAT